MDKTKKRRSFLVLREGISSWDTNNVKNMDYMFNDSPNFNNDLSFWDVKHIPEKPVKFDEGAISWTLPRPIWDKSKVKIGIANWDTSNVKDMSSMFNGASSFNNDLSVWDVSNIDGEPKNFDNGAMSWKLPRPIWNVNDGKVGIANWKTSKVLNMEGMFEGAENFNNDLSVWDVHRIPEEPDNFDLGATNWELPRPIWGHYDGVIITEIISAEVVDVNSRENGIRIKFTTVNEKGEFVEGFTEDDLEIIFTPSLENYTYDGLVKEGESFYLTIFPDTDYKGAIRLEIKDITSNNEAYVNYTKKLPKILDTKRSKLIFNTFDDIEEGLVTLTLRLVDISGDVFEPDYFTKDAFSFVDELNDTPIEVIEIKDSSNGQYSVLVKTDITKDLRIRTKVENSVLVERYDLTIDEPSALILSVEGYESDEDSSVVIISANVINVVNGPSKGLELDDFNLIQQPINHDPGELKVIKFEEVEDGLYHFTLESDKDFKGQIGLDVRDIIMEVDNYLSVDYIAIKPKEIDYLNSKLLNGSYTNPDLNAFTLEAKIIDMSGEVYTDFTIKDLSVSIMDDDGEVILHDLELIEDTYKIKGVYSKVKSITVLLNVRGKPVSDSALLSHPLEVLNTSQVDILDHGFEVVEELGRLLTINVTARDINGRYVTDLNKDDFKIVVEGDQEAIEVVDLETHSINNKPYFVVKGLGDKYITGEAYVYVEGVRSTTSIHIDYMPIIQNPIDRELSYVVSGEYLDDDNTFAKLVVLCLDKDEKVIEDLVISSFRIRNFDTETEIQLDSMIFKDNHYELYFVDYGITDLNLEIYVNDVRISKLYTLLYPRPRKNPVKTIATFDSFIVNEKSREISIIVEAYDDEGKLVTDLGEDELKPLLVPEQEDITLEIVDVKKIVQPSEKIGMYNFILKGSGKFSSKIGFHGEEVTVVIPTEVIDYDPVNIVDLENTIIIDGSYDPYNYSIVRMKVKCVDWKGNPIRHLRRSDFEIRELKVEDNLFIISTIESEMPGIYNITFAFDEVRKATFTAFVLGVPTANTLVLEHPILLKTTVKVEMSFIEFVEAGGKRYIDTLVKPLNHLEEVIPDLQKGLFVTYFPVESFERDFDITRFTSLYDDDNNFLGYGVQLYRPTPYKGLIGISVDSVEVEKPIEVDYDPVVIEEETPEEEEPDRIVTIVERHEVPPKGFVKLYTCDTMRNNAIVDLSIFSDIEDDDKQKSLVNLYLSDNPGLRKGEDRYLIKQYIPISNFEIGKIIVGSGQTLYMESLTDNHLNVRVSGLEELANFIGKSGLIASVTNTIPGISEVYRLDFPLATYASININVINNTNADDTITLWIVDNQNLNSVDEEYRLMDKVAHQVVKKKTMMTLENITLGPNERIYIHSKVKGVVTNVTGMIITPDY